MKSPFFTPDNEEPDIIFKIDYRTDKVKEFLKGKDVLDMGCGSGYSTKEYVKVAKSIIGIDISEDAIEYAKYHYPEISVKLMDMRTMKFRRKFDVVVATEVLEHATKEDGIKTLGRVVKFLKPDGMFVGTVPTEDDRDKNEDHKSFYTRDELNELLGKFFSKVTIEEMDIISPSWFFVCEGLTKEFNPKVSIIMPVYNQEKFVAEAIESALNQTLDNFELIICDDGSTDSSIRIVEEYARKDKRIKVLKNEANMGLTKTLNRMLKAATGEYICQLDSDDAFMPNRLEAAVKFMDEKNLAATYSDCYWIDGTGRVLREIKCMEFDLNMLFMSEYINQITIMYRKESMDKVGPYDEELKYSQDTLMKLEMGKMFGFTRIPEPLIKYRIREGSITQSKADEQRMYCDVARKKFAGRHQEFKEAKVTVGVPVYNPNMSHLKECLESIKSQTRKAHEVIVMDDGSKNSEEIENFVKSYGFKYFYQENKGIGGVRNAIIDKMSEDSDYLCYLSDDDVMHNEYIDIMCRAAGQSKGCILYSDFLIINDNSQVMTQYEVPRFEDFEDFCICCLSQAEKDVMFVNFSTTFFPAETIRRERFDGSFRFGEDLEFLLRTALVKKCRYAHVQGFLIKIRVHAESTTSKKEDEIPKNNVKIMEKIGGLMGWQS